MFSRTAFPGEVEDQNKDYEMWSIHMGGNLKRVVNLLMLVGRTEFYLDVFENIVSRRSRGPKQRSWDMKQAHGWEFEESGQFINVGRSWLNLREEHLQEETDNARIMMYGIDSSASQHENKTNFLEYAEKWKACAGFFYKRRRRFKWKAPIGFTSRRGVVCVIDCAGPFSTTIICALRPCRPYSHDF